VCAFPRAGTLRRNTFRLCKPWRRDYRGIKSEFVFRNFHRSVENTVKCISPDPPRLRNYSHITTRTAPRLAKRKQMRETRRRLPNSNLTLSSAHVDRTLPPGSNAEVKAGDLVNVEDGPRQQRVRLIMMIQYSGTHFAGFQYQPAPARTVQDVLEKAGNRVFKPLASRVVGASRTDGGVHAAGMVAHFDVVEDTGLASAQPKLEQTLLHLNMHLPDDVRVMSLQYAPSMRFHANKDATRKVYHYHLASHVPPEAKLTAAGGWVADTWRERERRMPSTSDDLKLDVSAMRELATMLQGMRCFRALQGKKKSAGLGNKRKRRPRPVAPSTSEAGTSRSPVSQSESGEDLCRQPETDVSECSPEPSSANRLPSAERPEAGPSRKREPSYVRRLHRVEVVEEHDGFCRIEMEGDGFLYMMCRKIAALLVECGAGRLSVEECLALVDSGHSKLTPRAAPAHGLCLMRAVYPSELKVECGDASSGMHRGGDDATHAPTSKRGI